MATRAELERQRLAQKANAPTINAPALNVTNPNITAQESDKSEVAAPSEVTNSNISQESDTPQAPDYSEYLKQNPGRSSLEYIYDLTQPKPKPIDPNKESRDRKMSSLYDLGGLLVNLGGVAGGAKAMTPRSSATEKMSAHYDKLSRIYQQRMQNYNAGRLQAAMQDARQLRSDANYRRSMADRRVEIKDNRNYENSKDENRNKSAIALENLRHTNDLSEVSARGKESRSTKTTTPGKNVTPIPKTPTTTTVKPVSRLQAQKIANGKDPDKARKELLAYFMDHGATTEEAAKEVVKYIPRTAKKPL